MSNFKSGLIAESVVLCNVSNYVLSICLSCVWSSANMNVSSTWFPLAKTVVH